LTPANADLSFVTAEATRALLASSKLRGMRCDRSGQRHAGLFRRKEQTAMKPQMTTIKLFERIARSHAFDALLVGALVVFLCLVGHDALRDMIHFA
jgi:hypothetical protein